MIFWYFIHCLWYKIAEFFSGSHDDPHFQIRTNVPLLRLRTTTTSASPHSSLTPGRLTPAPSCGTWSRGPTSAVCRATGSLCHLSACTALRTAAPAPDRLTHSGDPVPAASTRTTSHRLIRCAACGTETTSTWMWRKKPEMWKSSPRVTSCAPLWSQVDPLSALNVAR